MELPDLPIRSLFPALTRALAREGRAVVVAPPGAGKTTLVPLHLLEARWLEGQKVVLLEPRRLAARAAAHRMASLLGEGDVGGTVGYRIRRDTRVGSRTRIEVITEGVLTRMLRSDPALEGVGAVLFDEIHERSLHGDVGLALALQSRELFRPGLRLVAMSATLDPGPVAELLGGAPVLESQGRLHPVKTRFRARPVEGWIEPAVARTVGRALDESEGDVLVFLPGAGEIRRTAQRLATGGLPDGVSLHPLHGGLSRREQDRAIAPSPPGRRKVVLASAIAETSLTIEGVRTVVDSGLMRVPRFDPGTGMSRLETVRVTRDAADQRRGRAGRLGPGICYRLWTRGEDRGLVPRRTPEILDADLAPLALELAAWGAQPQELRWLDPPPGAAFRRAHELLGELELLDGDGALTELGREVAELGLHPRLGHMLVRAREMGLAELACQVAALVGERDVIRAEGRAPDADLRLRLEALRGGGRVAVAGHRADRGALARVRREAVHLARSVGAGAGRPRRAAGDDLHHDDLHHDDLHHTGRVAALAYPDRVARRREGERGRFLLRNGRGARFHESQSLEGADWLVAVEVEGRGREARIFRAAALEAGEVEALFGSAMTHVREVRWDDDAERVRPLEVRRLGAIPVSEAPAADPDPEAVARVLIQAVRNRGLGVLPWTKETTQLRERLGFMHALEPDRWPDVSDEGLLASLERWLGPFVAGMRSLAELRKVELAEALQAGVPWNERRRLEAWAPTHVEVPSGSRIRVDYADPEAPALAVRLQEVFGLVETPRVGGGRVPLTLRLLSPAQRPVQVTRDLASFWRDAYFEVRKDLRGRYPKHYWPEDPLTATATRRTRPS